MTSTPTLESAAVLAGARADRAEADAAERRLLERVLAWAQLHVGQPDDTVATFGDTPVPLGGEGCPLVSQFAVAEFGVAVGMSRRSTEALFSEVLELAYRLPRTWERVLSGRVKGWKARHVAQATTGLSAEAAAYVDAQVAPFVGRISPAELQRLIDSAIARFMPEFAQERAAQSADSRFVAVNHQQVSFSGTSQLYGELDLADALDLDQALQIGAQRLADLGSTDSLDARRSEALGNLARGELTLDLADPGSPDRTARRDTHREVVLYVHLSEAALASGGTGVLEHPNRLVTTEQIQTWTGSAGRVTVRPVIDLNEEITSPGYRPSATLREQTVLKDGICPFPYCERSARSGDQDHLELYDPDGPAGQTTSSNLGSPCRFHHRLKTHGGWEYRMITPGRYHWRSPHGYTFLTDRSGTRDLTPRPVDPPGG